LTNVWRATSSANSPLTRSIPLKKPDRRS